MRLVARCNAYSINDQEKGTKEGGRGRRSGWEGLMGLGIEILGSRMNTLQEMKQTFYYDQSTYCSANSIPGYFIQWPT